MRKNIQVGDKVLHTGLELIGTVIKEHGYYFTVDLSNDGKMLLLHCMDEELISLKPEE